jgi:hypothetical protein
MVKLGPQLGNAERSRSDALLIERTAPYGFPKDREERMKAGKTK